MRKRWSLHLLLLCLFTLGLSVIFVREPGFGDDLTYWTVAYDLHAIGLKAWNIASFHDLRWPVWGVCWLLQGLGLQGFPSYAGVAMIYLTVGSAVAFTFARLMTGSIRFSWAAGLAFLFCPLLDTVCHRPMPDISEGVWGGLTLLAWWRLMKAESNGTSLGWAVLVGLGVFITESNRLTGVFIAPVLFVATLFFARRRFWWLVLAGSFAAFFYGCEAAFYHQLFPSDGWLHNLKANMLGKGNKGTGNIPFLTSPFRFLDSFWKVGRLAPYYCVFAVLGLGSLAIVRRQRRADPGELEGGRISIPAGPLVAVWFIVLYLEYSCAPQSIHPWAPVIRDAARFLAGLAIPFSIFTVLGIRFLLDLPWLRARRWGRWVPEHPLIVGTVCVALLLAGTSREFFHLGFLKDMGDYVRSRPDGTRVFTLHMMRALAIMSEPTSAKRLQWTARGEIMDAQPYLEKEAAAADEFWYIRKIAWLNNRKRMERDKELQQPAMGSYLANPDEHWALAKLLVKGDGPDLAFYRKRTPEMPVPVPLAADAPEFAGLLPTLPATWEPDPANPRGRSVRLAWTIPASLRGKVIRLDVTDFSHEVETVSVFLRYDPLGPSTARGLLLKPYSYSQPGHDFFLVPIPAESQHCHVQLRFSRSGKPATLQDFKAFVVTPLDGPVGWDGIDDTKDDKPE